MPRKKIENPIEVPTEVAVEKPIVEESVKKIAFREFLRKYRNQSPHKYAIKEAELIKKLNSL